MDLAIRTFVIFWFIFLLTRIIGRRELSSLEPFDLILLIVLGDAIQQGLTQDDYSVTGAFIAVATIAAMQIGVSYLAYRFGRFRRVVEGEPIVIVQDGEIIERNMRRQRLTPDEVAEEARQQQIASLDEIQWAVLETSGQISFIKKSG